MESCCTDCGQASLSRTVFQQTVCWLADPHQRDVPQRYTVGILPAQQKRQFCVVIGCIHSECLIILCTIRRCRTCPFKYRCLSGTDYNRILRRCAGAFKCESVSTLSEADAGEDCLDICRGGAACVPHLPCPPVQDRSSLHPLHSVRSYPTPFQAHG